MTTSECPRDSGSNIAGMTWASLTASGCCCREAERAKLNAPASTPAAANAERKAKHFAQRKDLSQPRKVGPVYVQILDKVPEPKASGEGPCWTFR